MTEDEIDRLYDIFYNEAPYDYILAIEPKKQRFYLGACFYDEKICRIFGPDTYDRALFTMFHEIAHARIQHKTHSAMWAKEFVKLLKLYKYPKDLAAQYGIMEPNILQYISS